MFTSSLHRKTKIKRVTLLSILLLGSLFSWAQETIVRGKITDANSGDPIPFVNVIYIGTSIGAITDFDGNYELKTFTPQDSLVVSYIGYKPKKKVVEKGKSQVINFQLEEEITRLKEVVFFAGENPAYEILRRVVKNKSKNDKRKLSAFEYDTYTKIEVDVDNISDKFREKKIVKKITQVLDSIERMAGEDGKPILPVFITETVSKIYYRDNPRLKFEHILKSKISGLGVEDGSSVIQFVGSSFQEYNFYQNWLSIVGKDFVSPIADGWRLYYEVDLIDSVSIGNHDCYRLDFFPKSEQDLAFTGSMWITRDGYALKQIEVAVGSQANLNFVEKIRIQQELTQLEGEAWLPIKNRVLIDIGELSKTSAGMLAKFYTSNKNFVINKPYKPDFYEMPILTAEDARTNQDNAHWDSLRHEPLSETEKNVYRMIDTLQSIPIVRTYTDLIKIMVNGYLRAGKIDIGPYSSMFAVNNLDGVRIQPGFKTNIGFSNKWVIGGQVGYGFRDERVKYMAFVQHILSRHRWTTVTLRARSDLGRVGIDEESIGDNFLLLAAQRFGVFRRGYYFNEARADFKRELFKGFTQRAAFRYFTFDPAFDFAYYENPGDLTSLRQQFQTSEIILESRYARDELFIQDDNERYSLGTTRWPVITLRYTKGLQGVFGSSFEYDKIRLSVHKRIRFGPLGNGNVSLTGEKVFSQLPYPLLALHIGNETPLYTPVTFNLMNYSEFVSDRYASLQYQHHFEGFLLNRIPLMKKLKWRLVGSANVIYGGLDQANRDILQDATEIGSFNPKVPYAEMGYGVENIFRFLRIDFVHRLTYLDTPYQIRKFAVLVSMQFSL